MNDEANRGDLRCPECRGKDFTEEDKEEKFLYGKDEIEMTCTVPVIDCEDCGFKFTDDRAEWIRTCTVHDVMDAKRRTL